MSGSDIAAVAWFVTKLGDAIAEHSDLTPAYALATAIRQTADRHRDTCDLSHPATPAVAVAIVQARRGFLHYLVLGDVTVAIDRADGPRNLREDRVAATAIGSRRTLASP